MQRFFSLIRTHKLVIVLSIVMVVSSFLRLYRIHDTLQFLGDQGRDALIVRRMLIEHHPALIGPVTSVGNMYLGPFYYYFMLFPQMLICPNSTGPAVAVALVGIATVWLIYVVGRELIGKRAAVFAMALYAISPLVIQNVRFSWNPNIVPFFAILLLWAMRHVQKKKDSYWIVISLIVSILIQLHYITLALVAMAGLAWIGQVIVQVRTRNIRKSFIVSTLLAALVFLASLFPLVAFDVRHVYMNSKAFASFFTGGESHFTLSSLPLTLMQGIPAFAERVTGGLFYTGTAGMGIVILGIALVLVAKTKHKEARANIQLVFGSFLGSLAIVSLYHGTVYDHYLGFLFPLGALIIGYILDMVWKKPVGKILVLVVFVASAYFSWDRYAGKQQLGYNVDMMKRTADAVQSRVKPGETYDILVFADTFDYQGMNYRYFLTTGKSAPASEEEIHQFKTLFVLDEQQRERPLDTPQYKIAMWPNRTIVDSFSIQGGPKGYKLIR